MPVVLPCLKNDELLFHSDFAFVYYIDGYAPRGKVRMERLLRRLLRVQG